jgi:2-iminobutanoate/2-iminopropanoate deaminase
MEYVHTEKAPRAIGPYSQAVIAGDTIYTAGQIALDPETMELSGGDVASQTDRVLRNLAAVLEAAGSSLRHVVRTTVYLIDMADFPAMNEVYSRHFGDHRPARSTVAVAALP